MPQRESSLPTLRLRELAREDDLEVVGPQREWSFPILRQPLFGIGSVIDELRAAGRMVTADIATLPWPVIQNPHACRRSANGHCRHYDFCGDAYAMVVSLTQREGSLPRHCDPCCPWGSNRG